MQVVAHEMGHNFGSSHTHDCVWGPNNNQQIDDCGSLVLGGGSCYNPSAPIVPSGGGTIMSYCHLNSVGIDFTKGFGTEPGNLIRQEHSTCMCDNSSCTQASVLTMSGTYFAQPSTGHGASFANATHADWFEFTPTTGGTISLGSCNEGVDSRVHVHTGTCSNLNLQITSDDDCISSAPSANYASEIIDFAVTAGVTYYIEWDSRWSTASFDWTFAFVVSTSNSVQISCPTDFMGMNNCLASDYAPSTTGTASSTTVGASISYNDAITTTSCSNIINRTWTASANSGSSSSCVQYIDLVDTVSPTLNNCPSSIVTTSDSSCQAYVSWSVPSATDLCGSVTHMNSHSPGYFSIGNYAVLYTFMDGCGNNISCTFNITVNDGCNNPPPVTSLDDCDGTNIILSGNVQDDTHNAEVSLNSDGIIHNGTNPIFKAGQSMELLPGFEIKAGATLEMTIEDCQN